MQSAPGHVPPGRPDGTSQRLHQDFGVEVLASADRTVVEAGGTRLRPTRESSADDHTGSRVHAGSAGHPLCLRAA
ncbi:VOC family protein [Streptomyces tendae]|uniref:VOC family protein n=1 Tax=Streptomyces tendae TaxID=1932 RepID=UPI00248FA236|nr:VOC family protein [Streptomyces tendae]